MPAKTARSATLFSFLPGFYLQAFRGYNLSQWMQAKAIHTIFPQGYKKLDFRTAVLRCGTVSEPENRRLKIPVKTGTEIQNY